MRWEMILEEPRIVSLTEVTPLTDAHVYAAYTKSDLAQITGTGQSTVGYLHPVAAYAFDRLKTAGEEAGFRFTIDSAWRPWNQQQRAYEHFRNT
ncbi:MAG: hypothetical protein HKO76_09680, partial [Acidimicrobiia bacterium]|nr:hypothetical protein [Acidimicrobiia bacterium]